MPTTSENGCGRRSVKVPTSGCSSEAVHLEGQRQQPDLAEIQTVSCS